VALDQAPFAAVRWPQGIQAQLPVDSRHISVRFDPTGAATPQRIALGDGRQQMQIVVDAAGVVQVDAPSR
ncbi:type II secretion system protein GspH, partial [Xanthomonas perforans]|nr:type II secretion system protein GspH [Xanthomonas perforans]